MGASSDNNFDVHPGGRGRPSQPVAHGALAPFVAPAAADAGALAIVVAGPGRPERSVFGPAERRSKQQHEVLAKLASAQEVVKRLAAEQESLTMELDKPRDDNVEAEDAENQWCVNIAYLGSTQSLTAVSHEPR